MISHASKISIAIPTFNRVNYLRMAVESALSQTYANIEVIISDNASTDNTCETLDKYNDSRIVVVRQSTNIGMMANWNKCLEMATGDYFILLSDDDLLDSNAIEKMIAIFENSASYGCPVAANEIGVVYCRSRIIDQNGEVVALGKSTTSWTKASAAIDAFFKQKIQPVPCSILMRTGDVRIVGGYDAVGFPLIADAKVWMTIALNRGSIGFVEEVLASYRVHPVSTTNSVLIEEWIQNNRLLATFCSEKIRTTSDIHVANNPLNRINWFNAHVAAALIESTSDRSYLSSLHRYLNLTPKFLSSNSIFAIIYRSMRLLVPKLILKKIVIIKRKLTTY